MSFFSFFICPENSDPNLCAVNQFPCPGMAPSKHTLGATFINSRSELRKRLFVRLARVVFAAVLWVLSLRLAGLSSSTHIGNSKKI